MDIQTVKTTWYVDKDSGFEFTFLPVEDSLTIVETVEGFEARYLAQDENCEGPDEWGDDNLFLVGYHRDFEVRRDKIITKEQCQDLYAKPEDLEEYDLEWVKEFKNKYHVFGLEAYIHSGVCLSLSREGNFPDRQWDVSQLGCVFVAKEEWPEADKAKEVARGLIKEWNCALSGDVYLIVKQTYDKDKKQLDYDCVGGFYGHDEALKSLKTEI